MHSLVGRSYGALACRGAVRPWRAEALQKGGAGWGRLRPVVAPLRAGDLSLHDDEEGVAGVALLDQHGTALEVLRFECLGDGSPLATGNRAENRERSLRQRPQIFLSQFMNQTPCVVLLVKSLPDYAAQFVKSCCGTVEAVFDIRQLAQNAVLIAEQTVCRHKPVALCGKEPRGLYLRQRVCGHRHHRRTCRQRHVFLSSAPLAKLARYTYLPSKGIEHFRAARA